MSERQIRCQSSVFQLVYSIVKSESIDDKRWTKQAFKLENAKIGWCDKWMRNLYKERCPFQREMFFPPLLYAVVNVIIVAIVRSHRSLFFSRGFAFCLWFMLFFHWFVSPTVTMPTRALHQKQLLWLPVYREREREKKKRNKRQIAQSWINIINVLYLES